MQAQSMPGLCIGPVSPSSFGGLPTILCDLPHLHHLPQSDAAWLGPQQQPACHYKEESLQDKRQMAAIGKGSWLANTQLDLVQQTGITQILMPACPVASCSHYVYTNRLSAPLPAWGHHGPSAATHFASYWRLGNQII